ncbi:membrane-bound protein lytR [Thermus thermophilus]|nr:membrane-bound protein lytR [Thermus thermophilus]
MLGFLLRRPAFVSLLLPGRFAGGWAVDEAAWARLRAVYFEGREAWGEALAGKRAVVLFGPGQEALAQEAAERLKALGLSVSLRELALVPERTEVLENGPGRLAQALGEALGVPYRVSGEAALGADLVLRLGRGGFPAEATPCWPKPAWGPLQKVPRELVGRRTPDEPSTAAFALGKGLGSGLPCCATPTWLLRMKRARRGGGTVDAADLKSAGG